MQLPFLISLFKFVFTYSLNFLIYVIDLGFLLSVRFSLSFLFPCMSPAYMPLVFFSFFFFLCPFSSPRTRTRTRTQYAYAVRVRVPSTRTHSSLISLFYFLIQLPYSIPLLQFLTKFPYSTSLFNFLINFLT